MAFPDGPWPLYKFIIDIIKIVGRVASGNSMSSAHPAITWSRGPHSAVRWRQDSTRLKFLSPRLVLLTWGFAFDSPQVQKMFLLYVDDSGSIPNPKEEYFVLGGICVPERSIHWLSSQLDDFEARIRLPLPVLYIKNHIKIKIQ